MARMRRDARLETREARSRLKAQREPHWRSIHRGLAVGYRRGKTTGTWVVRRWTGGRYLEAGIGTADDHADADGVAVLSYKQAAHKAMTETGLATQKRAGLLGTVEDAVAAYIDWLRMNRKTAADTQIKMNAYVIGRGSPLHGKRLDKLTAADFTEWQKWALTRQRARPTKSPKPLTAEEKAEYLRKRYSTINRVIAALKAALNHALHEKNVSSDDAWRDLAKFKGADSARVRWLSEDEAQRLRSAAPDDLRLLIDTALMTGLRQSEITRLTARDFDVRSATVLVAESKSGKPRRVPLTDAGVALLKALVAGKATTDPLFRQATGEPWHRTGISRGMRTACANAKIEPCTFHELRHTFASHLVRAGVPLAYVADALGHRDGRMIEVHYKHLAPSDVADAIRQNLPDFGVTPPATNVTDIRTRRSST